MTTTEIPVELPGLTIAAGTPRLNKALAAFQAELPRIAKGETAKVDAREGKRSYSYDYAGLDAVSDAVLPALGRHGLAFTCWPTMTDSGRFVLQYELVHESGEQKAGTFPLGTSDSPQTLGGRITYYRRYALMAATGVAPGGEDDDAQSIKDTVQHFEEPRSAGEAFQQARPAQPRGDGNVRQLQSARQRPAGEDGDTPPDGAGETDKIAQALADLAFKLTSIQGTTVAALENQCYRAAQAKHKLTTPVTSPFVELPGVVPLIDVINRAKGLLLDAAQ